MFSCSLLLLFYCFFRSVLMTTATAPGAMPSNTSPYHEREEQPEYYPDAICS
jgi:hypothetical protein